jgi:hypothetical protein
LFSKTTISTWSGRLGVGAVGDAGALATGDLVADPAGDAVDDTGAAAEQALNVTSTARRISHRTHPP